MDADRSDESGILQDPAKKGWELSEGEASIRDMKKPFLCLVLALGPAGMLSAVEIVSEHPPSAYDQAVQSYVEAATQQMAAIRTQVDAEVGQAPQDSVKQRFAKVYSQLDECDQILADLKKAKAADFDKIKARFEQTRAAVLKSIDAARQG